MSYFCLNLGQTAEDSDMFTIIWLRPIIKLQSSRTHPHFSEAFEAGELFTNGLTFEQLHLKKQLIYVLC